MKILHIVNQSQPYAQLCKTRNISIKIWLSPVTISKWWDYNLDTGFLCWGQWPPRSQSTYQSIYQIILLCEKVGYKPVLSIFGITNYEHLDMHIYLLWGCTEMHKKDCKAYSTLLPWWGRGALWEEIVLWLMKCSYSIWGPPTSCPQRAYITFRIRKNNK